MKKEIIIVLSTLGIILCGVGAGYVIGSHSAKSTAEQDISQLKSDYQIQFEQYEKTIKQYKEQVEELKNKKKSKDTAKETEDLDSETEPEGIEEVIPDPEYEYTGFDTVFGAFCTAAQIDTIKNEAATIVSESEYKNIKQINCSEYTIVDPEGGKVRAFARLDEKGVLEMVYSIRYGTPSAMISYHSLKELTELEKYGRVMDVDSTETVTPYPRDQGGK